jgi:hypothetical protein
VDLAFIAIIPEDEVEEMASVGQITGEPMAWRARNIGRERRGPPAGWDGQDSRPRGARAIVVVRPFLMSIVLRRPSAKKPSDLPSGDQNGIAAFSVPARGRAATPSRDRSQIRLCSKVAGAATKASHLPSGDSANDPVRAAPGGGYTEKSVRAADETAL